MLEILQILKPGQIISPRELRDENSLLKRNDKNLVTARDVYHCYGNSSITRYY
jgi:hypothetical protein